MFLFRNVVQSLLASYVRIYEIKLFPVSLPMNFSLHINLFARIFAFSTVPRYGNMTVALLCE